MSLLNAETTGDLSQQGEPVLAVHRDSDAALSLVPWWSPDVPPWDPIKKPNSSLRIACVVSDRIYQGLQFEGEIYLLTPDNWSNTLEHGAPDFLLIDSFWESATGHWNLAQAGVGPDAEELRELIATARRNGIPTVYWFTEDNAYHGHYSEMASHFDHVFCADFAEIGKLEEAGIEAHHLPPCVQPALFNPFRWTEQYNALDLGVIFDGWAELDRFPPEFSVLEEMLADQKLSIIESRYLLTLRQKRQAPDELAASILGCVTAKTRQLCLKYASAYITFDLSLSTPTTSQWQALEAIASYLPVVHLGAFPDGDLRVNLAQAFEDDLDFQVELLRMKEDNLYRQRIAHRAWRETLLNHTYSHRINSICGLLGIAHDWEQYPKVSVLTPTTRPNLVPRAIENYRNQSYPERELVVVYNGELPTQLPAETESSDILVGHVPKDQFAGAAMNFGAELASGHFVFRMDDDGIYGAFRILDSVLWLRCVDAEVVGHKSVPRRLEESAAVYQPPPAAKPFEIFRPVDNPRTLLSNHSLGYQRTSRGRSRFGARSVSATDAFIHSGLLGNVVCLDLDPFNVIAERREFPLQSEEICAKELQPDITLFPCEQDFLL